MEDRKGLEEKIYSETDTLLGDQKDKERDWSRHAIWRQKRLTNNIPMTTDRQS